MKHFYLITGASKGLGRSIATELAKHYASSLSALHLEFLLVARSESNLLKTEALVKSAFASASVSLCVEDLSDTTQLPGSIHRILSQANVADADKVFLINNAGSVGDLSRSVREYSSHEEIQSFVTLNITSVVELTSQFLQRVAGKPGAIVNVSSLMAIQAFPHWGLYCMSKAARDNFHAVIAKEEKLIKTLNYAPGPLDTDMQLVVRTTIGDSGQKQLFSDMFDKKTLVNADASAAKLVKLLAHDSFDSGAHIDYYDC